MWRSPCILHGKFLGVLHALEACGTLTGTGDSCVFYMEDFHMVVYADDYDTAWFASVQNLDEDR